jgi:hypothetical protein
LPDAEALAGRTLILRHGDGTTRGWTLARVENTPRGARLHVREEPGFHLEPDTGVARYDRAPGGAFPGPHQFRVARLSRGGVTRP